MKKLKKTEMKMLLGGIRPPANGICFQQGENCTTTSHCCPNLGLICAIRICQPLA